MRTRPLLLALTLALSTPAFAIDSTLTYQGTLEDAGVPANGSYDLQFTLQDLGGATVGSVQLKDNVVVTGGVFTVELDFGTTAFTGPDRFLSIGVRPGVSTGAFTALTPRSKVTPAPYAQVADDALFAASVADNAITSAKVADNSLTAADLAANSVDTSEIVDSSITGIDIAPQSILRPDLANDIIDGSKVEDESLDAADLAAGSVGTAELLNGSILSADIGNGQVKLANIDSTQVQARVTGSCPIGNAISAIAANGTITCETPSGWKLNGNVGDFTSFIGTTNAVPLALRADNLKVGVFEHVDQGINVMLGSPSNAIFGGVYGATIAGGGKVNAANGLELNYVSDHWGTVGGGYGNRAGDGNFTNDDRKFATVSGGQGNAANGAHSSVGGGEGNAADGDHATIAGGRSNTAPGAYAVVAGGDANAASATYAGVLGGQFNTASGLYASVLGGQNNTARGISSVAAGAGCAGGEFSWAVGPGANVRVGTAAGALGTGCTGVAGSGDANGDEGSYIFTDRPSPHVETTTTGPNQFIVRAQGGFGLNVPPPDPGIEMTIASSADGLDYPSLWLKQKAASNAGVLLSAGEATGSNNSAFYIDHFNGVAATQSRRLALNADGSVIIRSNTTGANTGVSMAINGGQWLSLSDRRLKTAIVPVDSGSILERVVAMPISTWSYIAQGTDIRHLGPMAQDFAAAFGLGESDTQIGNIDSEGVALAAIQGLDAKLERENAALRADNRSLQQSVAALTQRLEALERAR